MARRLQLEVFDLEQRAPGEYAMTEAAFETAKLEAYERGYSAGWEDCAAGHHQNMLQFRAELATALNEYAFSACEARHAVLASLRPVFDALMATFVPALAQVAVVERAKEVLSSLSQRATEPGVTIFAHPELVPFLEEEALNQTALRVFVQEDQGMSPGQIRFCRGQGETHVDIDEVRRQVALALEELKAGLQKDAANE